MAVVRAIAGLLRADNLNSACRDTVLAIGDDHAARIVVLRPAID